MADPFVITQAKIIKTVPGYFYRSSKRFDLYKRYRHLRDTKGKRLFKKKMKNYYDFTKIDVGLENHLSDALSMYIYMRNLTFNKIKSISIHGRGSYSSGGFLNDEARGKDTRILEDNNPEFFIPTNYKPLK